MVLGNSHFLRRIDTDFVNLSPIVTYLQAPFPVLSTVPNATVITKGSASVVGIWVPLAVAQVYLRDHPAKDGEFDIFLSDELFERFPPALQDFHVSNAPGRMLNQFGRHFGSTLQVSQAQQQQQVMTIVSAAEMLARQQPVTNLPSLIAVPASTVDAYALPASMAVEKPQEAEVPLSATEREIFELCVVPDWDKDSAPPTATLPPASMSTAPQEEEAMEEDKGEDAGVDSDVSELSSLTSSPSGESPAPPQASSTTLAPEPPSPEAMEDERSDKMQSRHAKEAGSRSNAPLRRSRRVADLAATHLGPSSNTRTRTRGGRGSRNSIS